MSRKTARDVMAEMGVDPFADRVRRYAEDKAILDALEAYLRGDTEQLPEGLFSPVLMRPQVHSDNEVTSDFVAKEIEGLRESVAKQAEWLVKRQHPELKSVEITGDADRPLETNVVVNFKDGATR